MITMRYLATPAEVQEHWHHCEPLIERCVREAVHGEYTAADVFDQAIRGKAVLFYAFDESGDVKLAGALEQHFYPRYKTVNVLALAGEQLEDVAAFCFDEMKRFAAFIGAEFLEASAAPAMARLLRKLNFQPVYQIVRIPLQAGSDHVASA